MPFIASLFIAMALQADLPQVQQASFLSPQVPTLIILGTNETIEPWKQEFLELLGTDEALDLRIVGREVKEDLPKDKELGAWLRERSGLDTAKNAPRVWVLLGRDGQSLSSGVIFPSVESLVQALENSGVHCRVNALKTFLKSHPDHSEARRDLIQILRRGAEIRLRTSSVPEGQDLSPSADSRVWGALSSELNLLLQSEDSIGFHFSLDEILPPGTPESQSRLMKAVYRRFRPKLLVGLPRYPESPVGLRNFLRVDQALGEQDLLPTLWNLHFYHPPVNAISMVPYKPLARRIMREAQKSGNWRSAVEVLQTLWEQVAKPNLSFYDKAWIASTGPNSKAKNPAQISYTEREEVWNQLLAPLVEAMVRAESGAEVPSLLGSLDESWAPLGLEGRLTRLAKACGRPELSKSWVLAIQFLPTRIPRDGMLGTELRLFHQGQSQALASEGLDYCLPFNEHGISLDFREVPSAWIPRLGWNSSSPRWAMVGSNGNTLLQGEALPSPDSLWPSFQALGLPIALEKAQAFLRQHPGHLQAMVFTADLLSFKAHAFAREHQKKGKFSSAGAAEMGMDEFRSWQEYCSLLRNVLEDPLGTSPSLLNRYMPQFPRRGEFAGPDGFLGAKDIAERILPSLEQGLLRWPSDTTLWRAWLVFAEYLERSPITLLETLVPSPVATKNSWPSLEVLAPACRDLKKQGKWQGLVDWLQPRMRLKIEESKKRYKEHDPEANHTFHERWSGELTNLLLEAYSHLQLAEEAQAIQDAYRDVGDTFQN